MKKDRSTIRVFLYSLIAVVIIFAFLFRGLLKYETKSLWVNKSKVSAYCMNCDRYFQDDVATQNKAYQKEGITPQKEFKHLEQLKTKGVLVELKSNEDYHIREMDHSLPYVLPKVKTFLDELVIVYRSELNDIEFVPFVITSATRSKRSVKDLMGSNVNAITNSAHLKGKTIDISYKEFGNKSQQLNCFIKALKKLHEQQKCFVKFEKTGCLHITVR